MNAADHKDMTRPRIAGSASSCRELLTVTANETLHIPTATNTASKIHSVGDAAAATRANPNTVQLASNGMTPVLPHAAINKPPPTAPIAIAVVINPYICASAPNVCVATIGKTT
jgi:hypothetical protein